MVCKWLGQRRVQPKLLDPFCLLFACFCQLFAPFALLFASAGLLFVPFGRLFTSTGRLFALLARLRASSARLLCCMGFLFVSTERLFGQVGAKRRKVSMRSTAPEPASGRAEGKSGGGGRLDAREERRGGA